MNKMSYRIDVTVEGELPSADEIEELLSEALADAGHDVGEVACIEEDLAERLEAQVAAVAEGERGGAIEDVLGEPEAE